MIAADTAFSKDNLIVFTGSIIHISIKFSYSQVLELNHNQVSFIFSITTSQLYQALSAICLAGYFIACCSILTQIIKSSSRLLSKI
jgi:hypothetical protein